MNSNIWHTKLSRRTWLFGQFAAAGLLLVSALSLTTPVGAQEMECDSDPPIVATAPDGTKIHLRLMHRSSLRLADGRVVSVGNMVSFVLHHETHEVLSVVKSGTSYVVTVATTVEKWPVATPFGIKAWLQHQPSQTIGTKVQGQAGDRQIVSITVPIKNAPDIDTAPLSYDVALYEAYLWDPYGGLDTW